MLSIPTAMVINSDPSSVNHEEPLSEGSYHIRVHRHQENTALYGNLTALVPFKNCYETILMPAVVWKIILQH